jgi:hypothetical protein
MLPRLLFVIFTISFIAYTWFHTGKAKSHALNDPKGTCYCKALWTCKDKDGNETTSVVTDRKIAFEDELQIEEERFCCPQITNAEELPQNSCIGSKFKNPTCEHTCSCKWYDVLNPVLD